MKESRKEFIKKAHSAACSDWKENIEKEFPKLFKEDALVVGKWYKSRGCLFNYQKQGDVYGFFTDVGWNNGGWIWDGTSAKLATDKEVEEALIKEAKKRGFKEGVRVERLLESNLGSLNGDSRTCENKEFKLYHGHLTIGNLLIFHNTGKWATIVKTITKEQAEKELGKTILD